MRKSLLLIFMCVLFLTSQRLFGQGVTTATLSGVVRDATTAPVIGATVLATHTPSGTQYGSVTNDDGRYFIPGMRIGGPYEILIQFVGFTDKKEVIGNLTLGETKVFDVNIAETSEERDGVEILFTKDPLVNADRTGASTNIGAEQLKALPTLNRSLSDYTRLTPQAITTGGNQSSFGGRNDRFNNFTVDGSAFNNAFGLSGSVGGQANANPISLDAVEEVQINLAPYDVRQAQFTGAGVNAVTKAGTNEYKGSIYYFFRNQDMVGKRLAGVEIPQTDFSQRQYGFRVGGPIIKDKLFFFVNGEANRRTEPGSTFVAARPGLSGDNVSNLNASDLDQLKSFLISRYGYNPGDYEGYNAETFANNFTARLDYNINKDHKLNVRFNYLQSYRDVAPSGSGAQGNSRGPNRNTLPFSGNWYRINNNMTSVVAELNSRFGNNITNTFLIGYTAMRDFRESTSGEFPLVDIENGNNQGITSFGYEVFSPNNKLNTNIFQISNNLTYFWGKHTITGGFALEMYKTENGFMSSFFGRYRFNTLSDFYASANNGVSNATQYELRYSIQPGNPVPIVDLKAALWGFYVQDEFQAKDNLKITAGLRVDLPTYDNSVLPKNESFSQLTFRDGEKADVSKFAKTVPLFSPRVGFNWDVLKDKTLQVRGGTGIFTGRVPFVWISNQASNNGVIFGVEQLNNPTNRPFNPSVNPDWRPVPTQASVASTYNVAVTDENFKIPQVWRTNLAVDYRLKNGWVATFEAIYTKDINAVFYKNLNLPEPTTNAVGTGDNRPRYTVNRINNQIVSAGDGVIQLKNNQQGYQLSLTGQIQKTFSNGMFAMAAYNFADARDLSSLSGASIAASAYRDNPIALDPNAPVLSYSTFMLRHRLIASLGYEKEYFDKFKTSVSFFWEGRQGDRYSYTYGGDMNGDGFTNDLMYIPAKQSDILLVPATTPPGGAPDNRTEAMMWAQLDAYISQDPYLSANRGKYAARNGLVAPWYNRVDFRFLQDFYIKAGKTKNTLQLSVDIFNVLNIVNSSWGVERIPVRTQLLSFTSYDPEGRPRFSFPYQNAIAQQPMTTTFQNSTGLASRWQMQIGVRYIFN